MLVGGYKGVKKKIKALHITMRNKGMIYPHIKLCVSDAAITQEVLRDLA